MGCVDLEHESIEMSLEAEKEAGCPQASSQLATVS
jgi:hypothetical protein